jgi:hypothetical protein
MCVNCLFEYVCVCDTLAIRAREQKVGREGTTRKSKRERERAGERAKAAGKASGCRAPKIMNVLSVDERERRERRELGLGPWLSWAEGRCWVRWGRERRGEKEGKRPSLLLCCRYRRPQLPSTVLPPFGTMKRTRNEKKKKGQLGGFISNWLLDSLWRRLFFHVCI